MLSTNHVDQPFIFIFQLIKLYLMITEPFEHTFDWQALLNEVILYTPGLSKLVPKEISQAGEFLALCNLGEKWDTAVVALYFASDAGC